MALEANDVVASYHFVLEVDGEVIGMFSELSGVSMEREVITSRESLPDGKMVMKKLPGQRQDGDLVLKRGKTEDEKLWDWMDKVNEGKMSEARKTGSVVLYDYEGGELLRYNFDKGWPSRVALGGLSAATNEVLIEECTIVHEGLSRDGGGGGGGG
jgi:phage tail-like protein